ncbi:hypothetical protein [Cytobacillus kochii]|uniref:hypothetical protein n=1 Tax=Cytobacillus kochii TaxID=859143 RepID=UPI00248160A8|nr:hypothetical protein [Cytobacillus kochii]
MGRTIQARIDDDHSRIFEEIRSRIMAENKKGNRITPIHRYSDPEFVRDAEVLRYIIKNFKFPFDR